MKIRYYFRLCLILSTVLTITAVTDPCSTHSIINEWQRSIRNSKVSPTLCDSFLKEGWYQITSMAGEDMPTTCPHYGFRCGTVDPIWLNDTYPASGQTKNVTACSSSFSGDCCKTSYPIQVKNCTGYYVYKLVPTSNCPQAYCFGQELPCPEGHTSKTGFTPGCRYEPCLSVNHKILDKWQRSVGNNKTDKTICDSFLKPGWYKPISKAGNLMPTTCPKDGFRCGTAEPIWLNGTHPKIINQTMNGTACVSSFRKGCCAQSYDVQVRNCGKFNVYNLASTIGCPQAYCFGSEIPCPVGETSDTGFTPGCEFDPCYVSNYEILQGQGKRSSNYTLTYNGVSIDDSTLKTAWYTIQSETTLDIVRKSQPMNQCGTKYPIWMKGSLPNKTDKVVTRRVCMSGTHGFCQVETGIKVKNCGQFNVYFLPQTSTKDSAYCFGNKPYNENQSKKSYCLKGINYLQCMVVPSAIGLGLVCSILICIIRKNMNRNKINESKSEKQKPKGEVIQITDQEKKRAPLPPIQHSYVI